MVMTVSFKICQFLLGYYLVKLEFILSAYVRSYRFHYPHIGKFPLVWIELLHFYSIRTNTPCWPLLFTDKR